MQADVGSAKSQRSLLTLQSPFVLELDYLFARLVPAVGEYVPVKVERRPNDFVANAPFHLKDRLRRQFMKAAAVWSELMETSVVNCWARSTEGSHCRL